jgi:hypothetical protein
MSGRGGGGGGTPDVVVGCDILRFDAVLTSPQAHVVATLSIGEVLRVQVSTMNGQVVVQVLKGTQLVGGLTGSDATRLRACVDEGHQYKATVLTLNGGQVRVRVEHV